MVGRGVAGFRVRSDVECPRAAGEVIRSWAFVIGRHRACCQSAVAELGVSRPPSEFLPPILALVVIPSTGTRSRTSSPATLGRLDHERAPACRSPPPRSSGAARLMYGGVDRRGRSRDTTDLIDGYSTLFRLAAVGAVGRLHPVITVVTGGGRCRCDCGCGESCTCWQSCRSRRCRRTYCYVRLDLLVWPAHFRCFRLHVPHTIVLGPPREQEDDAFRLGGLPAAVLQTEATAAVIGRQQADSADAKAGGGHGIRMANSRVVFFVYEPLAASGNKASAVVQELLLFRIAHITSSTGAAVAVGELPVFRRSAAVGAGWT